MAAVTMSRNVVRRICGLVNTHSDISLMRCLSWQTRNSFSTAASNEKPNPEGNSSEEQNKTASEDVKSKSIHLAEENKKLIEQIKEIDDKYKRALAENENVRQRMRRQIEETKQFGIQGFCKDLLEVADILSKATESVPQEALTEENIHLVNLYNGLQMTEDKLQSVFRRHALTQVNPLGEKFDPNQHEALFEKAVPSKEPGTVCEVAKVGYKLHGRTIRPATVGVVKAA